MGIYIFPIFLFGCAMTGIVFLGIQQAADWAKDEAARSQPASEGSENPQPGPPTHDPKLPGKQLISSGQPNRGSAL